MPSLKDSALISAGATLRPYGSALSSAMTDSRLEHLADSDAAVSSSDLYRYLFEEAADGIFVADAGGKRYLAVNQRACELTGYSPGELLGMSTTQLTAPEDLERMPARLDELNNGHIVFSQRVLCRKDGSRFTAEVAGRRLSDGRLLGLMRDTSQRTKLEAELRRMDSMGRLAGGIAHDFNNLLTVILGGIESTLASLGAAHPHEPCLVDARAAALRSAELTRSLLAFARKQAVHPTALDINQSVEKTLSLLRRLVGTQIELTWTPSTTSWRALIDRSQFDQILMNLVINARDAIERTGTIRVTTENITDSGAARAEHIRLVVSDDGSGMDAETQARAFEPYFTTKGPEGGSGIGLSTVYGIVMQSSGRLKLISARGLGTSMLVDLPRFLERPDAPIATVETSAASGVPATPQVVEDDTSVLRSIEKPLQALG